MPALLPAKDVLLACLHSALSPGDQVGNQAGNQAGEDDLKKMIVILAALVSSEVKKDILLRAINVSVQTKNVQRYIDPLEKAGLIEKTIPDKPTSPKQQYRLTARGQNILKH